MSTVRYYVDAAGRYLGASDGAAPAGGVPVPSAPDSASWIWEDGTWQAPAPSPPQQAAALLAAGLAIASTSAPELDDTYPTDPASLQKYIAVQLTLLATASPGPAMFPGGVAAGQIKGAAGFHTVTPSQYQSIALAIAGFVSACQLVIDGASTGASTALPPATAAIP